MSKMIFFGPSVSEEEFFANQGNEEQDEMRGDERHIVKLRIKQAKALRKMEALKKSTRPPSGLE